MISARITLPMPGPKNAANAIASKIPGNERNALIRMMLTKRSSHPPKYPASAPMASPISPAPKTTLTLTSMETRAPYTTRAKTSRPSSSVPIQCAALGEASRAGRFCAVGLVRAIHGAPSARMTSSKESTKPHRPIGLRRRNSSKVFIRSAPAGPPARRPRPSADSRQHRKQQSAECILAKADNRALRWPAPPGGRFPARRKLFR